MTSTARQLINAELAKKTTSAEVRRVLVRIRSKLPREGVHEMIVVGSPSDFKQLRESSRYRILSNPRPRRKVAKKGGTSSTGPRIFK